MHYVRLTVDVDWAPDWAIEELAASISRAKIGATWFLTHETAFVNQVVRSNPDFEIGIHPNFLPSSTHGNSVEEVLARCIAMFPEAVAMRSHSLHQSTRILEKMKEITGISIDVSTYLRDYRNVKPTTAYVAENIEIMQVPFVWEDNLEFAAKNPFWNASDFIINRKSENEITVLDVHPIHYFLNSSTGYNYETLKRTNMDFTKIPIEEAKRFVNRDGPGTRTFVDGLLALQGCANLNWNTTLKDLVQLPL
jgi:hypothetical protein